MATLSMIGVTLATAHMNECLAQGRHAEAAAIRRRLVQFNHDVASFIARLDKDIARLEKVEE